MASPQTPRSPRSASLHRSSSFGRSPRRSVALGSQSLPVQVVEPFHRELVFRPSSSFISQTPRFAPRSLPLARSSLPGPGDYDLAVDHFGRPSEIAGMPLRRAQSFDRPSYTRRGRGHSFSRSPARAAPGYNAHHMPTSAAETPPPTAYNPHPSSRRQPQRESPFFMSGSPARGGLRPAPVPGPGAYEVSRTSRGHVFNVAESGAESSLERFTGLRPEPEGVPGLRGLGRLSDVGPRGPARDWSPRARPPRGRAWVG